MSLLPSEEEHLWFLQALSLPWWRGGMPREPVSYKACLPHPLSTVTSPSLLSEYQQQTPCRATREHTSECPRASPRPGPHDHKTLNPHLTTTPLQRNLAVLSVKACMPVSHIRCFSRPMMPGMQKGTGKRQLCEQLSDGEPGITAPRLLCGLCQQNPPHY